MIAPQTLEMTSPILSVANGCAEAVNYLADGAGASRTERLLMLVMLDALKVFSYWTTKHSIRVGVQVRAFADALGYSARDAARFGLYACLHDTGKLSIPVAMLEKPGKFSAQERQIMETHVQKEFVCLEHFNVRHRDSVKQVIQFHHENYDGTGYPDGLAGNLIPEIAQITRICDFFDAVRQDRPYRKGMSLTEAIALMQKSPGAFNPKLFRAFVSEIDSIDTKYLFPLR